MMISPTDKAFAFVAFVLTTAVAVAAPDGLKFDVRAYGAGGDGLAKDTVAIQRAIDAASAAGGGKVVVSPGTYLCGSIFLKSHVELHLEKGARIKGSPDRADYNAADVCLQNWASPYDNISGGHLILAIEQEDVALTGEGVVDGNHLAFFRLPDGSHPKSKRDIPWRPGQMVFFVESRGVRVRGLRLENSPYWTFLLHGCEDVEVDGLDVYTCREPRTYNGDGIDVDCCRNVRIRNCKVNTDDDSITLRANGGRLRHRPDVCEDIVIENCTLSSICNGLRLGVGTGTVRKATVRNCRVVGSRFAVCLVCGYRKEQCGTAIEDVRFENLEVEAEKFLVAYHRFTEGHTFRNIVFDGVKGRTQGDSRIYADNRWPFEDFTFRNVFVPEGFDAINVRNLAVEGGDFPRREMTSARAQELNNGFLKNIYPIR